MSLRSLPVVLAALLLLPACTLLNGVDTGPPSYTWTNGTPPSADADTVATRGEPPPLRVPVSLDRPAVRRDTVNLTVVVDDPPDTTAAPSTASSSTPPESRPDTTQTNPTPKPTIRFPNRDVAPPPSDITTSGEEQTNTTQAPSSAEPEPEPDPPISPPVEESPEDEPPQQRDSATDSTAPDTMDAAPAPLPRATGSLDMTSRENRNDLSLPDFLTGRNKMGGTALRFRRHVPPDTPSFVDRTHDDLPLFLADETDEGWLGFYKGNCGGLGEVCDYRAILFGPTGASRWTLDLNQFLTRNRFVEIQDIRLHDGALYFNEACATYADEADGQCSYLVRVDPEYREIDWRTPALTSNNIFIFADPYVVAGYGFTAEDDFLHLVEQRTGRIAARTELDSAHEYLEVQNGTLYVVTYRSVYAFDLVGDE